MIKIQQLSDETINQIAAGEVVENPAAVVKELLENAIDGGSTQITVEIVGGGFSLIKVSDNGLGMNREEARLSFLRHTTSKLSQISDLGTLRSMGFRGEALASIASVAKVEIKTYNGLEGTSILLHGGKVVSESVCARTLGTTISVESLFYNTPARKSFQKSAGLATSEILKVVTKAALAFPECSITLFSQGEELLSVQSSAFEKRVGELLGYRGATLVDFQEGACRIRGVIGSPEETRVNRSGQYLFINKRPIFSYLVSSAVLEGYGTRLESKRFPVFALHFDLPPSLVDVNVHPQKSEVRFKEEREVASLFRRAVLHAWQKEEAPDFIVSPRAEVGVSFENFSLRDRSLQREEKKVEPLAPISKRVEVRQVLGPYALFEEEEKLWLIDLLGAKARLVFDQIVANREFSMEQFLFPEVLEFSLAESALIREHLPMVEKVGIALRSFGKETFLLEALAPFFSKETVKDFLLEIVRIDQMAKEKWAEVASRYARRERVVFSPSSAKTLIETFYRAGVAPYCPKGRPILLPYTEETLERLFV